MKGINYKNGLHLGLCFVLLFDMRLFLVIGFACVASAFAGPAEITRSYHEDIGIPEAARIRAAEEVAKDRVQDRIVGGSLAPANEHPYLAGLLIDLVGTSSVSVCGATLLSTNRLVTAAHCWYDGRLQAWQVNVVLGTLTLFSGGTRIASQQVVMHGSWNTVTYAHDIAMIYLPTNVQFSNSIAPVALPEGFELFLTFEGQISVAAGYGRTSDQQTGITNSAAASHVSLRIISWLECQAAYGFQVNQYHICTSGQGGVGICGGDSGGPLVTNSFGRRILVGVTSFTSGAGCQISFPSGFTRVTSYINFINQHL